MNKRITASVLAILCYIIFIFPLPVRAAAGHLVCVDPGHGGTDSGAVYKGLAEKTVTLDIATRLQTLLGRAGDSVVMTRTSDITLGNSARATICNNAHAEALVSIHLNASSDHTVDYTEGLYGTATKDQRFATAVNSTMTGLGIANSGITDFADGMLLNAVMPATLAETVFISSDYEYRLLTNGTGGRQQQIAQQLLQGINKWFSITCSGNGCNGQDPSVTGCAGDAYDAGTPTAILDSSKKTIGYVVNRYSPLCGTNWAKVYTSDGSQKSMNATINRANSTGYIDLIYHYPGNGSFITSSGVYTDMVYDPDGSGFRSQACGTISGYSNCTSFY